MNYYYAWKNNEKRITLYKRACRIVARGRMNSCLIEFEDGQREVVSRNAVKRIKCKHGVSGWCGECADKARYEQWWEGTQI